MRAKEFYVELAKTERKWRLSMDLGIRLNSLSAYPKDLCPVTSVCFLVTKRLFGVDNYKAAGRALKLDHSFVCRVVDASDSQVSHPSIRSKLLKAVGL